MILLLLLLLIMVVMWVISIRSAAAQELTAIGCI
jgi:preprotein translocase subunit YajC